MCHRHCHYIPLQSPCPQSTGHRLCSGTASCRSASRPCRYRHSNPWQVSAVHHSLLDLSAYPVPMCHPLIGDRQRKRNIPARHPYFPPFSPHCRHFPSAQPFSPGLSPSQSCRYAA